MATPVVGAGFLLVNDILTDVAFCLIQSSVNTAVPAGGVAAGSQTVNAYDPSMYVGAQVVVGAVGSTTLEVVTITAVVVGTSFTATFANAHSAGESIVGATYPVRQPTDPLFEQEEMLQYISSATNDFLTAVPLVYAISDGLIIPPTTQNAPLPSDCMVPTRIAVGVTSGLYPLRETSQANLDGYDYRWALQSADQPWAYYRDKVPMQQFGIWPRANNNVACEIVYQQRVGDPMGLADGFPFPDQFLPIVKYRVLSFAFSKDGEVRNAGLAKYFSSRYDFGVCVANMILESINDPNLELAQS